MAARKSSKKTSEAQAEKSFEDSMKRLSEIVDELEGGDLSLEDSLKRFEEGVGLARQSQSQLDDAESRVEELLGVSGGGTVESREIEDA